MLLVIDPTRLTAPIRVEALGDGHEQFPHMYGPLNIDAVLDVIPFEPSAAGGFELPRSSSG